MLEQVFQNPSQYTHERAKPRRFGAGTYRGENTCPGGLSLLRQTFSFT